MTASERMSTADHLLWLADQRPDLRSTIVSLSIFAGTPDREALAARLDQVSRAVPRLRQRVRANPVSIAPPRWELDPDFSIDEHLRWIPDDRERTLADVIDLTAQAAVAPFATDRPLWEMLAVPGLPDGQFALIAKLHHAIADGLSGIQMQLELLDFEPEPAPKPRPDLPYHVPLNQLERVGDAISWDLRRRAESLQRTVGAARSLRADLAGTVRKSADAATSLARVGRLVDEPLSPLLTGRSPAVTHRATSAPLTGLKDAAKRAGTKLNAAFLATVGEALRTYHEANGHRCTQVRLGMPISTRADDQVGNQFTATRFVMPLRVDDDLDAYLRTLDRLVAIQRDEPALGLLPELARGLLRLPASAAVATFHKMMVGTDVQASNVPGSPLPMYLLGHEMIAQYPFGPTTTSALNVTVLSYVDRLGIGVATDPAAVTDADAFTRHLDDAIARVLAS